MHMPCASNVIITSTHSYMNRLVSVATVDGALLLFLSLVEMCTDRFLDLLKMSMTLLLLTLSKLKSGEHKVITAFGKCEQALNTMAVKLIGGPFFGGRIQSRSGDLPLASKELKVGLL